MTACKTCNYPLTAPREIKRGACLPHGIDNRLEMEAGMYEAGMYECAHAVTHTADASVGGVTCRDCGMWWPSLMLWACERQGAALDPLSRTLLADEGLAVVTRPEDV